MHPIQDHFLSHTRRHFFNRSACGLGAAALANCMSPHLFGEGTSSVPPELASLGALPQLHHKPTAKRVIWLFMADAPSQLDLYDYKPKLAEFFDKDLPESVRNGQRIPASALEPFWPFCCISRSTPCRLPFSCVRGSAPRTGVWQ